MEPTENEGVIWLAEGPFPKTPIQQSLPNDFYCLDCRILLVRGINVYRVNKNCVWSYSIEEANCIISEESIVLATKSTTTVQYSHAISCSKCNNHKGYYLPGYHCTESGMLVEYKMIITSGNGSCKMGWTNSAMLPAGPLHPKRWKSDKRTLENSLIDEIISSNPSVPRASLQTKSLDELTAKMEKLALAAKLRVAQAEKQATESKLRQVGSELETYKQAHKCPICLEKDANLVLLCGHRVCHPCRQMQNHRHDYSCPICRQRSHPEEDRKLY